MKSRIWTLICVIGLLLTTNLAVARQIEYLDAKPLIEAVQGKVQPVTTGKVRVPLITWGGDVATILASSSDIFEKNGLNVELFLENNFTKQIEACLSGKTPYLRGTMGMINAVAEKFKSVGKDLVVVYQMTWSTGGDAMVIRPEKKLSNIKTLTVQLYGPHMDYAANLFKNVGRLSKVKFMWLRELTLPTYETDKIVDPVSAFQVDKSLDAVMCIIPDALALTSGGTVGTGAAGSVKGAEILLSTKTASRIIADVYAVRKDYLYKNRDKVHYFVLSLMQGEEELRDLIKNKASEQAKYRQLLTKAATLLLDAPQATGDVEALMEDCEFVGHEGNIRFFTGKGTTRSLKTLTDEIQTSYVQLGLIKKKITLDSADWDYNKFAKGLRYASKVKTSKKKFDVNKVAAKVQKKISVEPTSWAEEGTLFEVEINFSPNQSDFPEKQYSADFKKALEIAQTYGGSLVIIEGHSDPLGILKARQKGKSQVEIGMMEQQAKNLSLQRANSVRDSFLGYCKRKTFRMDESQFLPVGLGIGSPKFNPPRTKDEWMSNRRVVFRIKQVEAELDEFTPLN
jgi:ABC-type nitrate/sulfonate/bicarbonate transport system substrate-binding protein/outer membrane protein OmpA-like peptidoglycan-associated protein